MSFTSRSPGHLLKKEKRPSNCDNASVYGRHKADASGVLEVELRQLS